MKLKRNDGTIFELVSIEPMSKIDITILLNRIDKDGKKHKVSYTYYYWEDVLNLLNSFKEDFDDNFS